MKKWLLASLLFLIIGSLSTTYAQYDRNWALGFRVGEPLGLNIRKYFNSGDNAFDLNIGTYGLLYNSNINYNGGSYNGAGLAIQGHYLWHREVAHKEWFHVYYGFGGQINNRTFYETVNTTLPQGTNLPLTVGTKKISLGGSGTAGAEFKLPNSDLAIFIDAAFYIEVVPAPLHYNPGISAGVRLNLVK